MPRVYFKIPCFTLIKNVIYKCVILYLFMTKNVCDKLYSSHDIKPES